MHHPTSSLMGLPPACRGSPSPNTGASSVPIFRQSLVKQALDKSGAVEAFVTARLITVAVAFIVGNVIAVLRGIDTVATPGDVVFQGLQS